MGQENKYDKNRKSNNIRLAKNITDPDTALKSVSYKIYKYIALPTKVCLMYSTMIE